MILKIKIVKNRNKIEEKMLKSYARKNNANNGKE